MRHIDAWNRIQLKERNKYLYFLKYTIKNYFNRLFSVDFSEELLKNAFDSFYSKYKNNIPVKIEDFRFEEYFEIANDLYQEKKTLLEYWKTRNWNPIDRVLDDQMFIRLVKIRHKLNFDLN